MRTLALLLPIALASAGAIAMAEPDPAAGEPALATIRTRCIACHGIDQVLAARKTAPEWAATLDAMAGYGAEIDADERMAILGYLTTHNGR